MSADPRAIAARALTLVDLTDLTDDCTPEAVDRLCARAVTPHGHVAAVCVWPRFVEQAVAALAGTGVKVATVVNFPGGGDDIDATVIETARALLDGADEIDLVLPYHALLRGQTDVAVEMVHAVATTTHAAHRVLKVILETGELPDAATVTAAARLAVDQGADFIKTSTGKTPVSATPDAARAMLAVIATTGRPVGLKPSGGIRTVDDAATYLALADEAMGAAWAAPDTFRFGASGLLDALLAVLDGGSASGTSDEAGKGY